MTGKQLVRNLSFGVLVGACLCFAQTDSSDTNSTMAQQPEPSAAATPAAPGAGTELKSTQGLWFALDEGQDMQGAGAAYRTINRLWQQRMYFRFTNDMSYLERLRLIVSIECQLTFSQKQVPTLPSTLAPLFFFYPNDAELSYSFGNLERPWLRLSAGYFPFQYNHDAKDLGEYLIKDGAYPTYLAPNQNFEFVGTRELGFHLNGFIGNPAVDQLAWDLMFTSETHFWPLQDWTLSAVVSDKFLNFFEVGAGASWQRLISINEDITTPKNQLSSYINADGDTSYFTYRALKLMGRASISPMRLIPEFRIPVPQVFGDKPFFGREDLKVYSEIGVLGLTNYVAYGNFTVDTTFIRDSTGAVISTQLHNRPGTGTPVPKIKNFYDSLGDRMPFMVGINLPTNPLISYGILPFILTKWLKDESGTDIRPLAWITLIPALASGVCSHYLGWNMNLDVLSFEFEWMSQRFPNDNELAIDPSNHRPTPQPEAVREATLNGTPQRVKYALYFKKSFLNEKFALSGLVARDHMRPAVHADPTNTINDDFLQTKPQWWWTLRLSANF